jgi:hypothetical protein
VHDWEQPVRSGLGADYCAAHPEVVRELAGHLEEVYEERLRRGESPATAERRAREQVSDWMRLRRNLQRAGEGEAMRNQQIRAVWLPGLLSTLVGFGLLRAIFAIGAHPWAVMQMPVSNVPHLDTLVGERVAQLFRFEMPWWLVLPLAGATGAFASWRAGGRPLERVVAALFPSLAFGGVAILSLFISVFFERGVRGVPVAQNFFSDTLHWVFLPGLALLLGSLPFARLRTQWAQVAGVRGA